VAHRGEVFRYESYRIDAESGRLSCRYSLDGRRFEEHYGLAPGERWTTPGAAAAARLVFLLAGVSYYKTKAPPVVDLGDLRLTESETAFLRLFYVEGLGECAYCNQLDLTKIEFHSPHPPLDAPPVRPLPDHAPAEPPRVLVPFGGGIDSIVTVEGLRRRADVALFVMHRAGDRFDAIEEAAAVSALPVVHASRAIDMQLLRSEGSDFLHGHVPVTGILSAVAILAAALHEREHVVMSNEWSASAPTREYDGRPINHQWSKSLEFEEAFRRVLAETAAELPAYFSALRDRTELWVARRFSALSEYHGVFRSCNKSFRSDPARRLTHWCGVCDKCCFIDLILAPFMSSSALEAVFAPLPEPLADPDRAPQFRALLGEGAKPFECVGAVEECRAATLLAAGRADRAGSAMLQALANDVRARPDAPADAAAHAMFRPVGPTFAPPYLGLETP
jgi:UDP-N-acetyl-alpha-D-muramoyl-L-alanyl-L-glutamate epimerase